MANSRLEIKSGAMVSLAYVIAPLPGLTGIWLVWFVLPLLSTPYIQVSSLIGIWLAVLLIGELICLFVEIVVVTPILLGFARYGWRWLNGRSAAVVGFAIGFSIWFLLGSRPESPGSFERSGGVDHVINGVRTLAGWEQILVGAFEVGIVGSITAILFRVIAVRTVPGSPDVISEMPAL